jgi:hypothetical protein
MFLAEPTVTNAVFKWTDLLPALTPITILVVAWKARGWFDDLIHKANEIHSQTTNHIPTLLTSIDKNLSILVDRTK